MLQPHGWLVGWSNGCVDQNTTEHGVSRCQSHELEVQFSSKLGLFAHF